MKIEEIPVLGHIADFFYKLVPHMDFEGQRLAEKIYQFVIVLFAVVGFVWGYFCEDFAQTVYIIGAGLALASLLVLPPWPFYRRHSLSWQSTEQSHSSPKKSSKGTRKGKRN